MNFRKTLDKINTLTEGFAQGSDKRIPLQHLDVALQDILTVKHWVQQAIKSSGQLDRKSNVPNDRFLQKKLSNALLDVEKVERDLYDIADFIKNS